MNFGNILTAFAVPLLGLFLSICFFLLEILMAKSGCCKKVINAYNYRIEKSEFNKFLSAEVQDLLGEISELLLRKNSSAQDFKMLVSKLNHRQ